MAIVAPRRLKENSGLAINGGRPGRSLPVEDTGVIPEAADAVAKVVRTGHVNYWRGGPQAKLLEQRFAELIGKKGAFFHNSGSASLLPGLYSLGADENSTVAISSSGFVASLNALYHRRSRPVFLPTCPRTLVCATDVRNWVSEPIDVLLVTQLLGNVIDIDALQESVKPQHLHEDASQALGSKLRGQYVGSHGDVSSFAGSNRKLLGAGHGGINVYDREDIGERMRVIGHHGKAATQFGEVPGFNFRGGEMEAILALAALARFEDKRQARLDSAQAFRQPLIEAGIQLAEPPEGVDCSVVWFDTAIVLPEEWDGERDWLVNALRMEGVPGWVYPPLIEMPWVRPWMESKGWWLERENELLERERALWNRVFVVGSQMCREDAARCGETVAGLLAIP
jgi:dTDP-4-amino-4,6-dideoxygalactose transaminase